MRLAVDDDELAACTSCGLCLPHCPTYRVTHEESESPRGRIAAIRAVHSTGDPPTGEFAVMMDHCVQCRGCETACPSGVRFGKLVHGARRSLATGPGPGHLSIPRRAAYRALGHPRLLGLGSRLIAASQRLHLLPPSLGIPRLPLRSPPPLRGRGDRPLPAPPDPGVEACLFVGCVMDAWMRPTHQAVVRVMAATGTRVGASPAAGCCGALAAHAGWEDGARTAARRVVRAHPGDAPIVVDSAGCGAQMKAFGTLLGTPAAHSFAARVQDASEWLAPRLELLPEPATGARVRVAVQDPCHLRHVQHAHQHVRTVLDAFADVVELDDDGLCCGAGGSYSILHRDAAAAIRALKLEAIRRSGAQVVVSANPGCAMHLAAAGVTVRHPLEVVDAALAGPRPGERA